MSETATVYFKNSSIRKNMLMHAEAHVLLSGIPRNHVTGAGKHLRWISPEMEIKAAMARFRKACVSVGLPIDVGWDYTPTLYQIKRAIGWVESCKEYFPAMIVIGATYSLKNWYRPIHPGKKDISWLFDIWGSPRYITMSAARGYAWLIKANEHTDGPSIVKGITGRKVLECFGKLTPLSRWVMYSRLPKGVMLSHRDMDWEFLGSLKRSQKLALVPEKIRVSVMWNEVGVKCPKETEILPTQINLTAFKKVSSYIGVNYELTPELFDAVLRLVFMFGKDSEAAIRYVEAYLNQRLELEYYEGGFSATLKRNTDQSTYARAKVVAVHDCAQKFPLVKSSPGWRAFVVKSFAVKGYAEIMDNMTTIEDVCGGAPKSVSEARLKFKQKGIPWVFDLNDTEKRFIEDTPVKNFEMCPYVQVEYKGYTLTKLAYNDPLQVSIGRLVDCCQHLDGAGSDCAAKAWTSGYCAIYAVHKGDVPVSQTFAWRGKNDSLVFDSLEALGGVDRKTVCELFLMAAKKLVGKIGIRQILVGKTHYGLTSDFIDLCTEQVLADTPNKEFSLNYSDANYGCVVVQCDRGVPQIEKTLEYPSETVARAINELSDGSDVYCEYCEAEVHPTCEVCPTCHEDISEWV